MTREKGHATVLFGREELLLLEFCVLYALHHKALDPDTAKDAHDLLQEIKLYLGDDAGAIGERLIEKLRLNLDERPPA